MANDHSRSPGGQEWLTLRVAFGDPDDARQAWEQLEPVLDIDGISHDAHGVFPQLLDALRRLGVEHQVVPRLEGVRRRLWTRNSVRLREVAAAAAGVAEIDPGVSAGGGLAVLLRQDDLSRRPLVDADLVVGTDHAAAARDVLVEDGWREVVRRRDGWLMDLRAVTLERSGHQVTLRWAEPGPWPYLTDGGSAPLARVDALTLLVPGPADLLVHTLAEGFRLWGYTPTRRYADALLLLSDADLDWAAVLDRARSRRAQAPVVAALERIAPDFPSLVPAEALERLRVESAGTRARVGLATDLRWGSLAVVLRRTNDRSLARALAAAPREFRELKGSGG